MKLLIGDLYNINNLDNLGSQDDQNDPGDLGGLEDLDYKDDQSDEDDQSHQYEQGYLADVDDEDDMDDFVNLRRYQGFLPPGEGSDDDGFFEEQNVELHFLPLAARLAGPAQVRSPLLRSISPACPAMDNGVRGSNTGNSRQ
ncbi:hypothetical protein V5799_009876 [Amblyomma americanum]|uniref:Uncharacterized protein n=1 Tax=Amblyomma americanum TaxID=6943 RepID=A0AAQ4F956_AMBAM